MAKVTALGYEVPVRDLDTAAKFYCDAFGPTEGVRTEQIVFVGVERILRAGEDLGAVRGR